MTQTDEPTTPTTPSAGAHGGVIPRGLAAVPSSSTRTGRFGRMFRNLPVYDVEEAHLIALGKAMIQPLDNGQLDKPLGEDDDDENTATRADGSLRLPAGYTYFGQFVDHDITFDPVSSLARQDDPDALVDFRTPRLDLDSLYGRGPADQPYLYDEDGLHLTMGERLGADGPVGGPDLPRVTRGRAIIGDPRNDENLIVSQLQSAFIRVHNAVVDLIREANPAAKNDDLLKFAQQQVRWHYQWVIIHDFLPRLVGQNVVDDLLMIDDLAVSAGPDGKTAGLHRRFFDWHNEPFMPIEFSVAAYRFGHSMIRPSYDINDVAVTDPPVAGASRIPLFSQTGAPRQSLNGFRTLPGQWGVDWAFFLTDIVGSTKAGLPQPSYKIDATLSSPLGALPGSTAEPEDVSAGFKPEIAQDLAVRNLLRGKRLQLPSGEDVARAMGLTPLTKDELFEAKPDERTGVEVSTAVKDGLVGKTPLWFYVLREAEVIAKSAHLGPVGGRIVAEVLIGLIWGDPLSYLRVQPAWQPVLPQRGGVFTLSDLIRLAQPDPVDASAPTSDNPYAV